ncbi:MAG: rod shape-determining protein MreD [Chloroflexi bacterium]|nr:rod shape-determining protein MreD [Chloroflexota bacterium]
MSLWISIPLLALVAIIQIVLLPQVAIFGYKPDLALALVVAWAMLAPVGEAAVWGFIIGIFLDLASGLPFGMHALALTTLGWLIGWGQTTFFRGNLLAPPVALVLATLAHHVILLGILALINWQIDWAAYLLRVTLPTALLNALVMPALFFPLQRVARWLRPQMEF